MTPIQEPQEVELPRGVVAEASAPLPVIQFPDGSTEPAPAGSVKAEDIIGQITSEQIEELEATKIAGKLNAEQIESVEAASIIGQIVSEQIQNLAAGKITGELEAAQIKELPTNKLTGFITNEQIKELETAKLTGFIVETQIGPEAITTGKLHATAVTAAKIAASAIVAEKIAAEAVEANAIKALNITSAKIAAGAIIAGKIGAEAVETTNLKALAVTTAKLAAESVIAEKIAASSITTSKLAAEAITAEKIAAGSIIASKIAVGAITAEKISVVELSGITPKLGTITAGKIEGTIIKIEEGNESAPEISRINWFKEGAVHTWIGAFVNKKRSNLELIANAPTLREEGEFTLFAGSKKYVGGVAAFAGPTGVIIRAETLVGEGEVKELDAVTIYGNSGISDFLQLLDGAFQSSCTWGMVSPEGSIWHPGGHGWTVSHLGTGEYKIVLGFEMSTACMTVSNANGAGQFCDWQQENATTFKVHVRSAGGALANGYFSFIVMNGA